MALYTTPVPEKAAQVLGIPQGDHPLDSIDKAVCEAIGFDRIETISFDPDVGIKGIGISPCQRVWEYSGSELRSISTFE